MLFFFWFPMVPFKATEKGYYCASAVWACPINLLLLPALKLCKTPREAFGIIWVGPNMWYQYYASERSQEHVQTIDCFTCAWQVNPVLQIDLHQSTQKRTITFQLNLHWELCILRFCRKKPFRLLPFLCAELALPALLAPEERLTGLAESSTLAPVTPSSCS